MYTFNVQGRQLRPIRRIMMIVMTCIMMTPDRQQLHKQHVHDHLMKMYGYVRCFAVHTTQMRESSRRVQNESD